MKYDDGDVSHGTGGRLWRGTYFFTVNLAERKRNLLVAHLDNLRTVMQKVKVKHLFHIDAMVILPDHLHALWTLPCKPVAERRTRHLTTALLGTPYSG